MAKTIASGVGMTNNWLQDQGLITLKTLGADLEGLMRWRKTGSLSGMRLADLGESLWEYSMESWQDVPGSKLTSREMLLDASELREYMWQTERVFSIRELDTESFFLGATS